jgi:ABC-2 type transport system ATP-binding protein
MATDTSGSTDVPAVQATKLTKSYRVGFLGRQRRLALEGLDLTIPRGEVFGYLGPNGSGKTTTLKILMGLVRADSGEARVLGLPLSDRDWRHRIGYLPEHPYLYDYLTPLEYLDYVGRLFGMSAEARRSRARELLELLGLSASAELPMRRFSKGMVQRAGLAQALMNDPEVVFLDEPMSGLDPLGRRLVRDVILDLKEKGKTVFFSTHILSDAESLCDRVALLRGGKLIASGRLDDILNMDASHMEVLATRLSPDAVAQLGPDVKIRLVGERVRLEIPYDALANVVGVISRSGGRILSVGAVRQSLEDYFVKEVGSPQKGGQWIVGD